MTNLLRNNLLRIVAIVVTVVCAGALVACSQLPVVHKELHLAPLQDRYPLADMSGYASAEGYSQEYRFVDMTVADVAAEMADGSSFVLFCGYNDCPWCNSILNPLNDILIERDIYAAYIDTRKDPSWTNNLDLENYDMFVELFGSELEKDENETPHLYVPHTFFIKDGAVVASRQGTVESQTEASAPLTEEQLGQYQQFVHSQLNALA